MRLFFLATAAAAAAGDEFFVCEAGDAQYLGRYASAARKIYTNANGKSVFRHDGFWYMGDVSTWPPVTDYRCVLECPRDAPTPPLVPSFTASKTGTIPPPNLTTTPCLGERDL